MFANPADGCNEIDDDDESSALNERPVPQLDNSEERERTISESGNKKKRSRQDKGRKPLRGRRGEAPTAAIAVEAKSTTTTTTITTTGAIDASAIERREERARDSESISLLRRIARGTRELAAIAAKRRHHLDKDAEDELDCDKDTASSSLSLQTPVSKVTTGESPRLTEKWLSRNQGNNNNNNHEGEGEELEKSDQEDHEIHIDSLSTKSEPNVVAGRQQDQELQLHCLGADQIEPNIHLDGCHQFAGKIEFSEAEEALEVAGNDDQISVSTETSLPLICGQLLTLVCGLIVLLYLIELANRGMTNLFTRILGGGERRRSLAAPGSGSGSGQADRQSNSSSIMQSHSSSTLALPRNSGPLSGAEQLSATVTPTPTAASGHSRRSSRSSIHSMSAMLMSAFSGGKTSNTNTNHNNGRSIIAKNKEDTVIVASSSPTIIQKESTDSVVSTPGAIGSPAPPSSASPLVQDVSPAINSNAVDHHHHQQPVAADTAAAASKPTYQSQYNLSTDRAHPLAAYLTSAAGKIGGSRPDHTIATVAAAAALDKQQLPTLATQIPAISPQTASEQVVGSSSQQQQQQQHQQHAPLNTSSTIRSASVVPTANNNGSPKKAGNDISPTTTTTTTASAAPSSSSSAATSSIIERQNEIIRSTELLLNALNQGDYETYTQMCDPHMTSFEPENLGNLIDNMEYRRLCLDQARQMQLQQHLKDSRASTNATTTATTSISTITTKPTQTLRQYSIILNPSVYLLGEDGASIAYTKLSQLFDGGQLFSIEKSEETRIWHRKSGTTKLLCVHLHRSIVESRNCFTSGPQTSATLARCMANQHELDTLMALQNQAAAAAASTSSSSVVPVISLNK